MRKRILIISTLALLVPILLVLLLLYTPIGVSLVAGQLDRLKARGIHIEGVSGTFAGPIEVRRFELDHPRVHVVAHDIVIDPQLRGLLLQTLRARSVTARDIEVQIREADMPPPDRPPRFLPPYLRVDARRVRLDRMRYTHVDGRILDADSIRGRVTMTSNMLQVRTFQVSADRFDAAGKLRLVAARPLKMELTSEGHVQLQPDLDVELSATLGGDLERLTIQAEIQRPSRISAQGLFARELDSDEWRITGTLASPAFSLQPWLENPPFSFADIALDVELDRERMRTEGRFTLPEYELNGIAIEAQGRFANRVLHVDSSEFTVPDLVSKLQARGSLGFMGGPPDLQLTATWIDLRWPLRAAPVAHSRKGELALRGSLPYEFTVDAEVDGPNLPMASGTAHGVLTKEDVSVTSYALQTLGGSASGAATLQFAAPRAWTIAANAKEIDPGELHDEYPGRISFAAKAAGAGLDSQAAFKLDVSDLRGRLRGEAVRGSGAVERRGEHWRVRQSRVSFADASLELDAVLNDTIDARWTFSAPSLEKLLPQARGSIEFAGKANGKLSTPHIVARARGEHLSYEEWSAERLSMDGDIDASNAQASNLSLVAQRVGHGTRLAESLQINGQGTALDHHVDVDVVDLAENAAAAPHAQMQIAGKYQHERWTASVMTTRFSRGDPPQKLEIAEPASVVLSRDDASLENLCFTIGAGRLCAQGTWRRNGPWEGSISGYEIPIATVLPESADDVEYAGRIEGSARAFGGPSMPWQGEAGMKISDVAIIYRPQGGEAETLNLGTGGMHIVAAPERIDFSFGVQAFTDTFLHAMAQLIRNDSDELVRLPFTGEVRARAADANLLPLLFPEVDHAAGLLTGDATIRGSLARPQIAGRIELADGELDSYRVNFALRDLDLLATIDGSRLDFRGTGDAGEGRLEVDGGFTWRNGASSGQMRLRGNDLLVADLPEYRIVASPDLRFDIERERIRVQGDITIPSALVQPARLGGAVRPSEDARYVGEHPAEEAGRYVVQSNVRVHMGEDVRVDAFGLRARIAGAVTTTVRTGEDTTGHGELRVEEGRYEAYGQQLDIGRGQLLFDNAPLDDPGLDIEARRRIETVTVGLNVRGTLQQPRLTFFSDPSMPQTQIVSYLLIGKPLTASAAGDSVGAASTSDTLALQGGGFLASQLGRRIGIEEVGVENYVNSAGEANPALVLGKFLSPRLFISYGISLTESINTLKLRYTISDRWIFRTESGDAQSADLEYMIER